MNPSRIATAIGTLLFSTALFAADPPLFKATNGVLADARGMTVYTYDQDETGSGKSACVEACARSWLPVPAGSGALAEPWSAVTRDDGSKQLAFHGKPLYTFVNDKKEGDRNGDGIGGAWHLVTVPR